MEIRQNRISLRPELLAIKAFVVAILAGTFLLILPFSSRSGSWTNPLTALFTATSATCVTGLIVVDTGSYFSHFGQLVILCLIQAGGIGIMTMGTFFLVIVGRRLSMQNEFVLTDALGQERARGVRSLILRTCLFSLVLEAAGALLLARSLHLRHGYSYGRALYHGIFHSVSAFCNAGFSLYRDSLIGFREDPSMLFTIAGLVIAGGLGFMVLYNISSIKVWKRNPRKRGAISLHSRTVLIGTLYLVLAGWFLFALIEWRGTLADMDGWTKLSCSFFQSVTPRTAGFNAVDMGQTQPVTNFITVVFMFIGGAPGSTAGGVKVTTMVVLMITVRAMIRGRDESELLHRTVATRVVREAITIFLLFLSCVIVCFAALLFTEHVFVTGKSFLPADGLLFEAVSALGTVGLSTGVTPCLSVAGKLCIIVAMFIGRLGPLTLALLVGRREMGQAVRYPEEEVMVG